MATYLYDDELIEYTLGDELNPPVRSLFLISDEETIFDVTIELRPVELNADNELVDFTLPLVQTINGKHYYSLPQRLFNYIELTGPQGPGGDEPTPTPSPSVADIAEQTVSTTHPTRPLPLVHQGNSHIYRKAWSLNHPKSPANRSSDNLTLKYSPEFPATLFASG